MAIEYARMSFIGRSKGKNACNVAAYNGNCILRDLRINQTFNFSNLKTNIYHEVLLPDYVDKRFKNVEILMNEVERCERRKDSTLLHQYIIALPNDEEITLERKIELTKRFIEKLELIKNNLAVVIDIHKPEIETKEINWYGKLLVTTRRFIENGKYLGEKARDLVIPVRRGNNKAFVPKSSRVSNGAVWRDVQNSYFEELGLSLRVDAISNVPQEHIGLRKYGILAELKRQEKSNS